MWGRLKRPSLRRPPPIFPFSSIFHHPSSFFPLTSSFFPLPSSIVTRTVPLFASDKKPKIADVAKIANSILRDISDYGDSDRKNQTDDLELTIGF